MFDHIFMVMFLVVFASFFLNDLFMRVWLCQLVVYVLLDFHLKL